MIATLVTLAVLAASDVSRLPIAGGGSVGYDGASAQPPSTST